MRLPSPFSRPWCIERGGFDLVRGVYDAARGGSLEFRAVVEKALAERDGEPLRNERKLEVRNGVAVVPVNGPLFRHAGLLSNISAASSYDDIRADVTAAAADPSVRATVLKISSPGGDADGVAQAAAVIYALRGEKPIEAVIEGQGASAAYWLAAACSRITIESTALAGCIGVLSEVVDDSGAEEKAGRKTIQIVSRQTPAKRSRPVDDAYVARREAQATELAGIFIDAVAQYRGIAPERVEAEFGQGDQLIGESARRAGLVDDVGTLEDVIARLSGEAAAAGAASPPALPVAASASAIAPTATRPAASRHGATNKKRGHMATIKNKAGEPEKKDEPAAAAEMMDCPDCDDGKMPDGSECESCHGSGEVEKKARAESDDVDPVAEDEEEMPAKAAIAAMVGLSASAPWSKIHAALAVKTVPHGEAAALRRDLDALKAERAAEKAKALDDKCAALADRADAIGYTAGMKPADAKAKRDKLIALARADYAMAADFVDSLPASRVSGRRTAHGDPIGKPRTPPVDVVGEEGEREVDHGGGIVYVERGAALSAAAEKYQTEHAGVSFQDALVAVAKEQPHLFAKRAS